MISPSKAFLNKRGKQWARLLTCLFLWAQAYTLAAEETAPEFPEQLEILVRGEPLVLHKTGQSLREVFFFDVYKIAHYIDRFAFVNAHAGDVLDSSATKQLQLIYLRDIKQKRVRAVLKESYQARATQAEWQQTESDLNAFLGQINNDIEAGDTLLIRWLQDELIFWVNGTEVHRINSPLFARILWSIWLGDRAVVSRDALLSAWQ